MGERWLVGEKVVSLAEVSGDGGDNKPVYSLWVATTTGLSLIDAVSMNLSTKAAHYQTRVTPMHDRYGFVAAVPLAEHGNLNSFVPTDGDNDGSATAYYKASKIFRYKVTRDKTTKQAAWRHFAALEFLHNVTRLFANRSGYIARTVVKCGEPHQGPSGGTCHVGGAGKCLTG